MRPYKLTLTCGLLCMAVLSGGCSRWVHQLQARDQLNKGVGAFRNAQFQRAIDHFQTAVSLDPTLLNARLYLATAYAQQYIPGGESEENIKMANQAIQAFEEVLKVDPQNSTATASIAQIYFNMKKFDKAKEYQRRRLELEPNNPEPYYWIAVIDWTTCFAKRMQLRKDLNLVTPKDPAKPDFLPPLPEKAVKQLQAEIGALVDEGIKALQKALELKPNDDNAMTYMNLMYREKSDLETEASAREADIKQAEEWFDKALGLRKAAAGGVSSASATESK